MHTSLRKLEAAAGATKTMTLYFPVLGQSCQIDGANFLALNWDMEDLAHEAGIDSEEDIKTLSQFWVTALDEEEADIFAFAFADGKFWKDKYRDIVELLEEEPDTDKVLAGLTLGIAPDEIADKCLGKDSLKGFVMSRFWEIHGFEIPENLRHLIDEEQVVKEFGDNVEEEGGYIFDLT